ncbi:hypothetical protein [Mycobacterium marinum]|uniref:hypothetical protein n=1 Tax=Mycobacterium marinum TaxID=1781 RepID=UPI0021C4C7D9|nr:hypothetical protein [Mycobacterium marinum]
MADSQVGKTWYQKLVRGLTDIFVLAAFIATAVASWWYTQGSGVVDLQACDLC